MFSYSKFIHETNSYYPYKRPISMDYRVFVNGEEIPVYTCSISKYPFNTVWPGHQRPIEQTELASFVNIVSDEELKIEVISNIKSERVLIKPYSKNIKHTEKDGKISFTLSDNGAYVLEMGSYHYCLYIFNSKPISAPEKTQVTYYFDAGIHFPGKITLKSNESIYIDKDALVYGSVFAEDAENIHIFGNGIFDDSHEERTGNYCYEKYINGNMKFYDCRNINIEGVGMTNSAIWCLNLFGCFNVHVDDIKIFGQWRYNSDGIDIVNCQNIFIKNSFIHSFDDTVTIKGIDKYGHIDNKNIHIDNCVLWCDWGKCCEVGVETYCREYSDISFRNCDVLRGGNTVIDINNGECAKIHDIVFENINAEFNNFDTESVYQIDDDMVYNAEKTIAVPNVVLFQNFLWRTPENIKVWGLPPLKYNLSDIKLRNIHDVKVKNVNVYYDKGLPLPNGEPDIRIIIQKEEGTEDFYNIDISDINVINL